ncbi:MAG: hypothetical protein ACTSWY_08795 [Promethearchaeota archaeon]
MSNKYSVDMLLKDLLNDPVSEKLLRSLPNFKEALERLESSFAPNFSLRKIQEISTFVYNFQFTKEQLEQIDARLKAL